MKLGGSAPLGPPFKLLRSRQRDADFPKTSRCPGSALNGLKRFQNIAWAVSFYYAGRELHILSGSGAVTFSSLT